MSPEMTPALVEAFEHLGSDTQDDDFEWINNYDDQYLSEEDTTNSTPSSPTSPFASLHLRTPSTSTIDLETPSHTNDPIAACQKGIVSTGAVTEIVDQEVSVPSSSSAQSETLDRVAGTAVLEPHLISILNAQTESANNLCSIKELLQSHFEQPKTCCDPKVALMSHQFDILMEEKVRKDALDRQSDDLAKRERSLATRLELAQVIDGDRKSLDATSARVDAELKEGEHIISERSSALDKQAALQEETRVKLSSKETELEDAERKIRARAKELDEREAFLTGEEKRPREADGALGALKASRERKLAEVKEKVTRLEAMELDLMDRERDIVRQTADLLEQAQTQAVDTANLKTKQDELARQEELLAGREARMGEDEDKLAERKLELGEDLERCRTREYEIKEARSALTQRKKEIYDDFADCLKWEGELDAKAQSMKRRESKLEEWEKMTPVMRLKEITSTISERSEGELLGPMQKAIGEIQERKLRSYNADWLSIPTIRARRS